MYNKDSEGEARKRRVSVSKSDPDISTLCRKLDEQELSLTPRYQRKQGIWEPRVKSRFVESLILGIPVPPIFVAVNSAGIWEVIDGLQRLTTLQTFVQGKWPLTQLEFLTDLNDHRFKKLDPVLQRRILSTALTVYAVPTDNPAWSERICNVIFDRVNSGMPLNQGERIRGTDSTGYLRALVDALVPLIRDISGVKSTSKRNVSWKVGAGVLLGILGLQESSGVSLAGLSFQKAGSNPTRAFLDHLRSRVDAMTPDERSDLEVLARNTLSRMKEVFGSTAFRFWRGGAPSNRMGFTPAVFQAYLIVRFGQGPEVLGAYRRICEQMPAIWNFENQHMCAAFSLAKDRLG